MNRIMRWVITGLGVVFCVTFFLYGMQYFPWFTLDNWVLFSFGLIAVILVSGLVFYGVSPWLINLGRRLANWIINELSVVPAEKLFAGSVGLVIGLVIAYLISSLLTNIPIPIIGALLSIVVYLFMGYLGVNMAVRAGEVINLPNLLKKNDLKKEASSLFGDREKEAVPSPGGVPKILDTSVIIDGRIADVCRSGFVEGPLVIPEFVLEELRHIADSSTSLKRNRGRRGLDVLSLIQKELPIEVRIVDQDFPEVGEVDVKLLKMAQWMNGKVVTNDYNLNKVASLQGVDVLNINELANAVKPVVLPGEEMQVEIIKAGKEAGQGLAYLDDGTMIVVEDGRRHIGKTLDVTVTSVLQTSAGRMIFVKPQT